VGFSGKLNFLKVRGLRLSEMNVLVVEVSSGMKEATGVLRLKELW
jgi:hypothetical protein